MTVEKLCEYFSRSISEAFGLSSKLFYEELFRGTNEEMTEKEIYSRIILNSILISANLSAQVVANNLVELNVITEENLSKWELKPQLHIVKSKHNSEFIVDQEHEADSKSNIIHFES